MLSRYCNEKILDQKIKVAVAEIFLWRKDPRGRHRGMSSEIAAGKFI